MPLFESSSLLKCTSFAYAPCKTVCASDRLRRNGATSPWIASTSRNVTQRCLRGLPHSDTVIGNRSDQAVSAARTASWKSEGRVSSKWYKTDRHSPSDRSEASAQTDRESAEINSSEIVRGVTTSYRRIGGISIRAMIRFRCDLVFCWRLKFGSAIQELDTQKLYGDFREFNPIRSADRGSARTPQSFCKERAKLPGCIP
jgi:hypothetical protein